MCRTMRCSSRSGTAGGSPQSTIAAHPLAAETKTHEIGGLDVGIEPLAVDSLGNHYENPKAYYRELKRLGRWQRIQARRAKIGLA